MSDLQKLMDQKKLIDDEIEKHTSAARTDGLTRIKDLMAHHGITLSELGGGKAIASRKGVGVAPKYKDPATGQTWSGRGLAPRWISKSGQPKEAFAIQA